MKVSRLNAPVYHDRNAAFNAAAESLVQDILQHVTLDEVESGFGRVDTRPEQDITEMRLVESNDPLSGFDLSGLSDYEKLIVARVVLGTYRTTVLYTVPGSGMTSVIDRVSEVLKRPRKNSCGLCEQCAPVVIKMDFNMGFQDHDLDKLLREFRWRLYNQLRQQLRELFRKTHLVDALREEAFGPNQDYAAFDRFVQDHENPATWEAIPKNVRVDKLFTYVDEATNNGTENIGVLMSLVRFAKVVLRADPGCLILIFDNIDSVPAEAQYKILAEILSHQAIAQVQSLVTLRRGTHAKFEIGGASYAFGTIDYAGPDIKEVIIRRLSHYAECWDSLAEVKAIKNPAYRQAIRDRLDYLIETKDDPHGAIQRVVPICGFSIRLGLYMCERFFLNSAIPYDESPRYKDDTVRAMLVGDSTNNEISPNDDCIANLLLNKLTGEASLLNIRVLQLIAEFKNNESGRTVRSLIGMLEAIGRWSRAEITEAFNYLLFLRRPLLWVDGKTRYDEILNNDLNDVLHLTEAGHFYLHELLLDLVYVQEAALSVRWNDRQIPASVDYSKVIERFGILRCFLEVLVKQDYDQTSNLMQWLAKSGADVSITPILFINRIMAALGKSALHILLPRIHPSETGKHEGEEMRLEAIEELRGWNSMIDIWWGAEKGLLGTAHHKLEQLSREYQKRVPLPNDAKKGTGSLGL